MTAGPNDINNEINNSLSIASWSRLAKAMDEAGKKLKEQLGEIPIEVGKIRKEVARITGLKESGIQPSDFCYNSKNDDPRSNRWNVFLKVGLGDYQYVGPFFDYEGEVSHNPLQSVRTNRQARKSDKTIPLPTPATPFKATQIDQNLAGKTQCDVLLQKLLSGPPLPFDKRFEAHVPKEPGLYAIQNKDGTFLHAGVSGSLRKRIFGQHFDGGGKGAGSDLVQKVQDRGMAPNRTGAKEWIRENCIIYWVVEHDKRVRIWAEHHMLAALQPIWGA